MNRENIRKIFYELKSSNIEKLNYISFDNRNNYYNNIYTLDIILYRIFNNYFVLKRKIYEDYNIVLFKSSMIFVCCDKDKVNKTITGYNILPQPNCYILIKAIENVIEKY